MHKHTKAIYDATRAAKTAYDWLTSSTVERPSSARDEKRMTQAATLIGMALRLLKARDATLPQLSLVVPREAGRIAGCHKTTVLRAIEAGKLDALTAESEGSVERGSHAVNVILRIDVERVLGTKGLNQD